MNPSDSKKLEKIKWQYMSLLQEVAVKDKYIKELQQKIIEKDQEIDALLQQAADREMWKAAAEKAEAEIEQLLTENAHKDHDLFQAEKRSRDEKNEKHRRALDAERAG